MRIRSSVVVPALVAACWLSSALHARADSAVSFIIGAGIGTNFNAVSGSDLDLRTAFKNSPIFGLRVGSYGFPFGFEGSLLYSPSALVGGAFDTEVDAQTNILYTEANVLLIPIPGPISPFVTGGLGLHSLNFDITDFASFRETKIGWNYGGGVMVNAGRATFRFDLRDHITTFGLSDFGLGTIGSLVGLTNASARVHNVELSFGVGLRF